MRLEERQFREIQSKLKTLEESYFLLVEMERRLLEDINRAVALEGSLVYKWVKNKAGEKYYYWYLHLREGGRTRSIYLGKEIPPHLKEKAMNRERLKDLEDKHRKVTRILDAYEKAVRDIASTLDKALEEASANSRA